MKIIRWLLSHSLFILLIVAVIYAYMFWGNLFGKDTPAGKAVAYLSEEFVEVKNFVDAVKAKQAEKSETVSSAQASSRENAADGAEAGIEVQAAVVEEVTAENPAEMGQTVEQTVVAQPPAAIAVTAVEQQPAVEVQKGIPAVQQPAKDTTASNGSKDEPVQLAAQMSNTEFAKNPRSDSASNTQAAAADANKATAANTLALAPANVYTGKKFVPVEVEKQLSNVDDHGEVINVSQPTGAIREKWITAREAFYQRNYELSEKSYHEVIDSTKNNFDAYGELGNVYFNQGKNKQAADAYFEAAAILINKGQVRRARSLMGLLRHLDDAKASELQQLIDAAQS
jgi:hypothetical protein